MIKRKTHQIERESDQARDEGRDDRLENPMATCPHIKATTNATFKATCAYEADNRRGENVTVLKMIKLPMALAYVVALVCYGNDQIVCWKNRRDVARDVARAIALVCFTPKTYQEYFFQYHGE